MHLATYRSGAGHRIGLICGDTLVDIRSALEVLGGELARSCPPEALTSMQAFIEAGPAALTVAARVEGLWQGGGGGAAVRAAAGAGAQGALSAAICPLAEVELLSPIPRPRKNIFCVGLNYAAHITEGAAMTGRVDATPEVPVFFTKPPTAVVGPGADIRLQPQVTEKVDFEVELAVVIGKGGTNIPAAQALDHVFGYTVLNDVSARDLQKRHGQWFKGKSLDTFAPMGPWIVTADALADPHDLSISLRLNGEVMQDSNTRHMIFTVSQLIAHVSAGMTLEPGDVIATGTPHGVGFARQPPVYLQDGDTVEAEIGGIGVLRNRVST